MAKANSPRQRMINLMYLVFIAMMALNMGKEVLGAFGLMNEKLEGSNQRSEQSAMIALDALKGKDKEERYKEAIEKAEKAKQLSDNYFSYLESVKVDVMGQNKKAEQEKDYQVMDKSDYLDSKFFQGDGLTDEGKKYFDNYLNYKKEILALLGDNNAEAELKKTIEDRFFSGENGKVKDREGALRGWMQYNYEGFPYIAAVTKMSQIQGDIRQTELDFYGAMLGEGMKDEISMRHYTTLLEQTKGAYYQNQTFDGAIVLGRKDNSTKPVRVELTLDGRKLNDSEYEIVEGKIKLKVNTGGIGERKITGTLIYEQNGEEIPVQVSQSFTVIPRPNEAVISADKMNVVYRGVDNPMTISMPGVPDNKITASGSGLSKKSGSNYVMKPPQGKEVTINVTGTMDDGSKFSSSKKFRIKDIPKPEGAILGIAGAAKLPKANIANGTISIAYDDFVFDMTGTVTSFRLLVPGQPSMQINGNKISSNPNAVSAINRAKKGDIIQISEIRYKLTNYTGTPKPATPISIEVQ